MKNIINVSCDDKKFHIQIDGENIDLLTSIAQILKKMETESNISVDISLMVIAKMVDKADNFQEVAE